MNTRYGRTGSADRDSQEEKIIRDIYKKQLHLGFLSSKRKAKIHFSLAFIYFFLRFYFFPFSPQSPPVHSCIFFVVGPPSCGMWDAASAWSDEQCHVHAQDSNQRNTGPPSAECTNLTTQPQDQPQFIVLFDECGAGAGSQGGYPYFINFLPKLFPISFLFPS